VSDLSTALGHGPEDRLVIVNCDDLGSSLGANRAVHRALRHGVATSATVMVPCPWSRQAAADHAGEDVGVHLTLTAEWPGYRWGPLTAAPSLRDEDGFFPRTVAEVWAQADLDEVRTELHAQVERAIAWGLPVTHLDSHMGTLQLDERYVAVYLEVARAHDLPLRLSGRHTEALVGFEFRDAAAAAGLLAPDHLIVGSGQEVLDELARLRPGVTEVFFHPCEDGPELRAFASDWPRRLEDAAVLEPGGEVDRLLEAAGAIRISYRPLLELQRARR